MGQPQKRDAEQHILSLGRVLQSLREEDNVDVLIETTISYLKEQFDYSLIWIALYDRLNHILFGKGGITPGNDTSFLQQRLVLSPGDLFEQVVIELRPLGVVDLRTEIRVSGWLELAREYNIQGTIILPIRFKDRCLGVVLLATQRWGYLIGTEARAQLMMLVGELGAVLYRVEVDLHHKQSRRIDEPLLQLVENLHQLNNLDQKLEAVVKATHQFVLPTRTNIYWFEREKRYFWLRTSNQLINMVSSRSTSTVAGITVQDLSDFYYALSVNQIVSIGEGRSSLKSDFTGKLLQRLGVRSLLAAPINFQNDLQGFLAVEGKEARIWTEAEKNFVKGTAGLISLVVPSDGMETTINKIQSASGLKSQIAQAIYSDNDIDEILHRCATRVLEQLAATRFLLLQYDPALNKYQVFYQSQPQNRRRVTFALDALKEVDKQLVQRASVAVGVENLEQDLRFFNWRSCLLENNMRSLLISNCTSGQAPQVLLVIANEVNRSWTTLEKELLQVVSQQIGVVVRQWQLHQQTQQQQNILLSFEHSLNILSRAYTPTTQNIQELERTALEQIASILNCPLAILLTWKPGEQLTKITHCVIGSSEFAILRDASIPLHEPLIYSALTTDGLFTCKVDDLQAQTREWLYGDIGQILVMALRTTADYQPTGVVIIASADRQWSEHSLTIAQAIVCQLAWSRRWLQISQILSSTTEELQQLNWYKHRRLEDIQTLVAMLISQMHEKGIQKNELTDVLYQQMLRQFDNITASMTALLKEQWQLHINSEIIPVTTLLKRSLERVENLLTQRKLWIGVHGLGQQVLCDEKELSRTSGHRSVRPNSLYITGDRGKIELVLDELLVAAVERSPDAGRIDIWCRLSNEKLLEVSITDYGTIEPQLLTDLHPDTPLDVLASSTLNQPPGLHLMICQHLMQKLQGELHLYQLPDGRTVSRLLLPLGGV